jgi:hypothetical protein
MFPVKVGDYRERCHRHRRQTSRRLHAGAGAWTALALVVVGSLAAAAGSVGAAVAWLGALANTWQLEDKAWFWSLLAFGLLGVGLVGMIAYVAVGPDSTEDGREVRARRKSELNVCAEIDLAGRSPKVGGRSSSPTVEGSR